MLSLHEKCNKVNGRLELVGLFLECGQRHSFAVQRPDAGLSMADDDIARLYVQLPIAGHIHHSMPQ
jgi:hypothetical protein